MKEEFGGTLQETGEEGEMLLVAERTSLREPTTFRDVVTSCREAGRVVREAANHYRELQVRELSYLFSYFRIFICILLWHNLT